MIVYLPFIIIIHFILFFIKKKITKVYALITPRNVLIFFIIGYIFQGIFAYLDDRILHDRTFFIINSPYELLGMIIGGLIIPITVGLAVGVICKIFKKNFKKNFIEGIFTGTLLIIFVSISGITSFI